MPKLFVQFKQELEQPKTRLGLALISILLLVKFVFVPWTEWRSETAEFILQQKNNLRPPEVIESGIVELTELLDRVKGVEKAGGEYIYNIPRADMEIEVQQFLKTAADENSVLVSSWSTKSVAMDDSFNVSEIDMRGEGPLDGVEQWLSSIENHPKLISVRLFELEKFYSSRDDKLRFRLVVSAYSYKESEGA